MSGQTVRIVGDRQRAWAQSLVAKAPLNSVVTIRPGDRTLEQNAKLWAMLSDVSRQKPQGRKHTPDVWKSLFMHACGHEVQFEVGLYGQPFPVGFRSSRMTKAQMTELIDFIDAWGTENGVNWSDDAR